MVYELAISASRGPSLYLVSDGAGVTSLPHDHKTWAVIAGIRGQELNHHYRMQSFGQRTVVHAGRAEIGAGGVLVLDAGDIHSTEVVGTQATFHLHLYGRPLHALPNFESRCHTVVPPRVANGLEPTGPEVR